MARPRRNGPRQRFDARSHLVPGLHTELRRAGHRRVGRSADGRVARLGEPDPTPPGRQRWRTRRSSRPVPRRTGTARCRPRRSRRCVQPEHRRDDDRISGHRQPRRDLDLVCSRVRSARRGRSMDAGRAEGAVDHRRLHVRIAAHRPQRARCADHVGASLDRARRTHPVPRPRGSRRLDAAARRARRAAFCIGSVRSPAVRAVLLRDHRFAEADCARARRDRARAPQGAPAALRPPTR